MSTTTTNEDVAREWAARHDIRLCRSDILPAFDDAFSLGQVRPCASASAPDLAAEIATLRAEREEMLRALRKSSGMLAFLDGAFGQKLKDKDREKLSSLNAGNRAVLAKAGKGAA